MNRSAGELRLMNPSTAETPLTLLLKDLLADAEADIIDYGDCLCVAMHFYSPQVHTMISLLVSKGYKLVSVVHVVHRLCSGSGREFWWAKS